MAKKKVPLTRLSEIQQLEGAVRYYQHERGVWFQVRVQEVGFDGCNVKCVSTLVHGIGSITCCAGELYTEEAALAADDKAARTDAYEQESRSFRYGSYPRRQRQRQFKELLEVFGTEEEIAELKYLGEGAAMTQLTSGMVDAWGKKLLRRKYKLEPEQDDDEDE